MTETEIKLKQNEADIARLQEEGSRLRAQLAEEQKPKSVEYSRLQELLQALGWQGGTIHQILGVLRRAKAVAQAHKEAEISGEWEVFKSEIYALRREIC